MGEESIACQDAPTSSCCLGFGPACQQSRPIKTPKHFGGKGELGTGDTVSITASIMLLP